MLAGSSAARIFMSMTGSQKSVHKVLEGENIHKFCNTATRETFLHEILRMPHSSMRSVNIQQKFSQQNAPMLPICEGFLP